MQKERRGMEWLVASTQRSRSVDGSEVRCDLLSGAAQRTCWSSPPDPGGAHSQSGLILEGDAVCATALRWCVHDPELAAAVQLSLPRNH
jgi:hypothetical protein